MPTVGVIGTGAMGLGVVQSLLRNGYQVLARDIRPRRRRLRWQQARWHEASRRTRTRQFSRHSLVVDAAQIDTVLFGPDGAASRLLQMRS
jgi:3-hydroxyisobutyrate dehydrogenase